MLKSDAAKEHDEGEESDWIYPREDGLPRGPDLLGGRWQRRVIFYLTCHVTKQGDGGGGEGAWLSNSAR